jgi:hypothetical protein
MKKSIKIMLAGLLAVPALALGMTTVVPTGVFAAPCDASGGLQGGADCTRGDDQSKELFGEGGVFTTITNTLLFVIGAISVLMLIYGGIRYTLSAGDAAAVTAAKNTILYAIVGIVVAIMAYAIVNFVLTQFLG